MISGSGYYQSDTPDKQLYEVVSLEGRTFLLPVVKLSGDSSIDISASVDTIRGLVSTVNSSTTPLLSSGTLYSGTFERNDFNHVGVSCKTDQPGILYFDFSNDGVNVDTFPSSNFSVVAGTHEFHTAVKLPFRYFRVRFLNEGGVQTYFRLYTYYGNNLVPTSSPLNQVASLDQDAIFTRGTIAQDEIRLGRRTGVDGWTKFAYRQGLTASGGEEMIWATSGNLTILTSPSTFTITYNSATDGTGTTGATQLTFYYVNSFGLPTISTHNLGGSGSDVTTFSGLGINRVAVSANGGATYNTNAITITPTTGGSKQAIIPATSGVTQQSMFFVGSNHLAVVKYIKIDLVSASKTPTIEIKGYAYNRNINGRFEIFKTSIDTAVKLDTEIKDPVGFNLNPTDVIYFVANSSADNVDIFLRYSLNQYQRT